MEIERLHTSGMGYRKIAKETDVPENTVKSYLRRLKADELKCPVCGKPLISTPGHRAKKFCSDKCRMAWWNSHRSEVKRKAFYTITCACCGKAFSSYGNADRKYCSRECYLKDRFEGGCHD
jgi:endogenous inhibitor of DNA gyrase (YacG/DUF329 family)